MGSSGGGTVENLRLQTSDPNAFNSVLKMLTRKNLHRSEELFLNSILSMKGVVKLQTAAQQLLTVNQPRLSEDADRSLRID